ncbi:hypothetical protein ACFQ21_24480 [Ohtaekwangia kribbensis]|uniref:Lipoprotein n=1 Tax=Ohtaekwangia kribbensis TaxID=688913 RepID=A0ABW3K9W7_9BACT
MEIKMKCRVILSALVWSICAGCSLDNDTAQSDLYVFSDVSDFSKSMHDWKADFSDYPATREDSLKFDLQYSYTELPANLGSKKAIMLSGTNLSNDLFMFIKKKVTGLNPNTDYNLVFQIQFATNAPSGASTTDEGSPGESVFLKAGASDVEPQKVVLENSYVLNVDKGKQLDRGENTIVLGNIAGGTNITDFTLVTRTNADSYVPFVVRSNDKGELWLLVGTDSGYKGTTVIYYTNVSVVFSSSY